MHHPVTNRIRSAAAFTIVELLVAVAVLVVVIVATAKIFSSASKVSSVAQANADLIQTAAVLEQQIRTDLAEVLGSGFLVIQQVEVAADGSPESAALDPGLSGREIRADQLAFFSQGSRPTTRYIGSQESSSDKVWPAQSAVCRIYYGHGVLAPTLPLGLDPLTYRDLDASLVPWRSGNVELRRWQDGGFVNTTSAIPATRPSQWPLARLATLLVSDGRPTRLDAIGNPTSTTDPIYADSSVNASVSLFTSERVRLSPL
ncbi:MAG: hypothetical protein RLZZ163_1000, partial [Actinomycetota bacterium]